MASYLVHPVTSQALGGAIVLNGAIVALNVASRISSAAGAVTVFAPAEAGDGECFAIVDSGNVSETNAITINGNGSLIDGEAAATLANNGGVAMFVRSAGAWVRTLPMFAFSDRDPSTHLPLTIAV